jgi:hypothetical protein
VALPSRAAAALVVVQGAAVERSLGEAGALAILVRALAITVRALAASLLALTVGRRLQVEAALAPPTLCWALLRLAFGPRATAPRMTARAAPLAAPCGIPVARRPLPLGCCGLTVARAGVGKTPKPGMVASRTRRLRLRPYTAR